MYDRFTDRSRKVMQLASQEALRFNHQYLGTEHILIGLVKEGSGVAANVLKNFDVDLRRIRLEVEKLVCAGAGTEQAALGKLPHTPRARKVVEYAIEEARNLKHDYVGTEHLLLGLLREQGGVAVRVLTNLGLKLEDVREEVLNLLGPDRGSTSADVSKRCDAVPDRVSVADALIFLNSVHAADPTVLPKMIENRIPCNQDLADHPTVQVCGSAENKDWTVGFLGIINGLFGVDERQFGYICAVVDDEGKIKGFRVTPKDSVQQEKPHADERADLPGMGARAGI